MVILFIKKGIPGMSFSCIVDLKPYAPGTRFIYFLLLLLFRTNRSLLWSLGDLNMILATQISKVILATHG